MAERSIVGHGGLDNYYECDQPDCDEVVSARLLETPWLYMMIEVQNLQRPVDLHVCNVAHNTVESRSAAIRRHKLIYGKKA